MNTPHKTKGIADRDIELLVGRLLRSGVITASCIVLIGGIYLLLQNGSSAMPSYHHFGGENASYTTFQGILSSAWHLNAKGIVQLGIVVLIATPVLRIALSLFGFALEKDWLYVIITTIVLAVMLLSTIGGLKI
ncbi:DUF1634 domain-containing protein [Mucilaginibacter celer]|uniref:DUF1634 domain-containing protein n=1 Tax=Mucilaginibacter celer TaxID=2305508 RepID=A0A494VUP9_9SPHI|nr:DUF1634 domain-containing protein [Mucilaginibacter celer]AYL98119.1 DUF1634 domain-containing protein [Mucilaginibacter celer]